MSSEGQAVKQAKSDVKENIENVADKASTVKDKVSDKVSNIADKKHQTSNSAKSLLNERTEKVSALAQQALNKADDLRHRAVDIAGSSSEYIKNLDLQETKESVRTAVKEKPEILLITVGILGLAVGYLLGKKKV